MLKTCSVCGRIHDFNKMCSRNKKKPKTTANKFRDTYMWKEKRKRIKERDKYLCQVCLKESIYNYDNLQVHHIIPIDKNYDLKLEESNLITLCSYHHKQAEQNKITKEYLYKLIDIPPGSND